MQREPHYKRKHTKLGDILGIQDKNGEWLVVGDYISFNGCSGTILFNDMTRKLELMPMYSMWYGNDRYSPQSYGKSIAIPLDNGAKMHIELLERYGKR